MKRTIDSMIMTCDACPVELEGTLITGEQFNFYYRNGKLTITVENDIIVSEQIGSEFDGFLEDLTIVELFKKYGFEFTDETTFREVFS